MIGVTLSRWTMSYFAAALFALVLGECLMAAGYGFPSAPIRAPQTLVLVHLCAIGWLSLLLCGALFQFVPVLIARPLHSDSLPLPTLVFLGMGLAILLCGFLQLAGTVDIGIWLFPLAATLLAIGFTLVIYNLGRTLWQARPLPLPARFVAVALLCVAVTVALGATFSFVFGMPIESEALLTIAAEGLPLHIVAGLGGWLTFTAMGVSYRLLAMFMLAPELEGSRTRAVYRLSAASLAIVILGGLAQLLLDMSILPALSLGAVLGFAALALYGADILYLYRARKRRIIELNSQMAALALISLAATVILTVILTATNRLYDQIGAVIFLSVFGWLSGLGLAKLYKIIAFLTWLECYGPVLGKTATPRVQDLVDEKRARPWFLLYFLAVWGATAALLFSHPLLFRGAAGAMTVATLAIVGQFLRTRRLSDLGEDSPLPEGAHRPRLLISLPGST